MHIAIFSTHPYDRDALQRANANAAHQLHFFSEPLNTETAPLAAGSSAVCVFVNDHLTAETLSALHANGVRLICLRSAGYDNVDLAAAQRLGLPVVRVPAYSPNAVAEQAFALLLTLIRHTHQAHQRVHNNNFSLDGLTGFNLNGKTLAVVGAGRIGRVAAQIGRGFGCRVLAIDPYPETEWAAANGVEYVSLAEALPQADVLSLHAPLLPSTRHLINAETLAQLKTGAVLVNTGRGALVDSDALLAALDSGHLAGAALDVYEREAGIFFNDHSEQGIQDATLARLLAHPKVLISAHQGFLTREALGNIATTVLENVGAFERGEVLVNAVG